jgi:putative sigma-54 modulation protein
VDKTFFSPRPGKGRGPKTLFSPPAAERPGPKTHFFPPAAERPGLKTLFPSPRPRIGLFPAAKLDLGFQMDRGVHADLTESLKAVATEKIQKLFHHNGDIIRVRVTLEMAKNKDHRDEFIAHGHIDIGGPDIEAKAATEDLYKSIDAMIAKLNNSNTIEVRK